MFILAEYTEYDLRLRNAELSASNSVTSVIGSLHQGRDLVCSEYAAKWDNAEEVKKICMEVTNSFLVQLCGEFCVLTQDLNRKAYDRKTYGIVS